MRIFSGIQPTGDKTIGNLIGGFRQYAATQEQGDAFFCIVDLHAITVEYEPADLRRRTFDRDRMLAAMIRIIDLSNIRIGNEVYAEENDSFGLSTLTRRHVDGPDHEEVPG